MREITYGEALLEAQDICLSRDESVYVMGLGVPDPKGIFGTTKGLQEKYGSRRVLDMPCAENAMTGIAIGSAINGMRPIMTHQRVDFFLLGLDQLINNAAKWFYMFGGQRSVPLVIRLIIGQGWGQGPQHSQSLQSLFAHIPGLKVVMPSNAYDAKGMLIAAVEDPNPVVFLEHRWLHGIRGIVPKDAYTVPFGKAKIVKEGTDVTIIALSNMVVEGFKALSHLEKEGISAELIDIRCLAPLDVETICESVKKTGKVVVLDPDWKQGSFAGEIITVLCENVFSFLKSAPMRITYPEYYVPTSWALSHSFYPTALEIARQIIAFFGKKAAAETLVEKMIALAAQEKRDIPDPQFTGPF